MFRNTLVTPSPASSLTGSHATHQQWPPQGLVPQTTEPEHHLADQHQNTNILFPRKQGTQQSYSTGDGDHKMFARKHNHIAHWEVLREKSKYRKDQPVLNIKQGHKHWILELDRTIHIVCTMFFHIVVHAVRLKSRQQWAVMPVCKEHGTIVEDPTGQKQRSLLGLNFTNTMNCDDKRIA